MKLSNTLKGYLLAIISVLSVSNVYIFSKAALKEVSIPQFGLYWFSFGLFWILVFAYYRKSFHVFKKIEKRHYFIMIWLGLFDVLSTYFFFKAIHTIPNPSVVSFIGNISPALVIILSIFFLKERFNSLEVIGIFLALVGAFVISYKGNVGVEDMFINGAQFVLFSSMISSTNAIIIKKNIQKIPPIVLTVNRTVFLLLFSLGTMLLLDKSFIISNSALENIFIGSVLGPFLTVITGFLALQYIPLSRKAIIGSTKGLFVLLGSYIYFGNFPRNMAIIGGIVTILGVLLITFGKMKLQKK